MLVATQNLEEPENLGIWDRHYIGRYIIMLKRVFLSIVFVFLSLGFSIHAYAQQNKVAILAGGCFWCVEADFDKLNGVIKTISGYDGGLIKNPTYQQVSSGQTNYAEAVKIIYDPNKITYQELLFYFWRHIDPTVKDAQFCDRGKQYRSAIFYLNSQQKKQALASFKQIKTMFKIVYTEVTPSTHFYPAEEYHQNYYKKNPLRYQFYRRRCGRDVHVRNIWFGKQFQSP